MKTDSLLNFLTGLLIGISLSALLITVFASKNNAEFEPNSWCCQATTSTPDSEHPSPLFIGSNCIKLRKGQHCVTPNSFLIHCNNAYAVYGNEKKSVKCY